jgi:hypothetical protein
MPRPIRAGVLYGDGADQGDRHPQSARCIDRQHHALFSKDYVTLLLVASGIGIPAAYYLLACG